METEVPVVKDARATRNESNVFCKKSLDVKSFRSGMFNAIMGTSLVTFIDVEGKSLNHMGLLPSTSFIDYSIEEKEQKEKEIFS